MAIEDREAIFDYIETESPRSAILVDDRIESQIGTLRQFPQLGREGRVADTRELVIDRTPYIAVDDVDKNRVRVLRVLHTSLPWPVVLKD